MRVDIYIENKGRAIAKYAGCHAFFHNARVVSVHGCREFPRLFANHAAVSWDAPLGVVIHPNGSVPCISSLILEFVDDELPIEATAKLYCEGMTTRERRRALEYPDVNEAIWEIDIDP